MSLPASLLAAVESHGCFSGCYDDRAPVSVCIDPANAPVPVIQIHCNDCLSHHVGALASLLPAGMSSRQLADELSAHVHALRGFRWAKSGYFTGGAGFWMVAVYFGDGLFLVDGTRNASKVAMSDLDALVHAFQRNIVVPDDPRMIDPALYTSESICVNFASPIAPIRTKQDLLSSRHVSRIHRAGFHHVSVLEFQPMTAARAPSAAPPAPPSRALRFGDVCPKCHATVQERELFSSTYIGCLC